MEVAMDRQPYAFASTFYFFADTKGNAKKIKRACKQPHHDSGAVQEKFGQTLLRTDRRASANSTYPKVAVQWLNQALCFYQSSCLADSEVLRNRHLRVAAKR